MMVLLKEYDQLQHEFAEKTATDMKMRSVLFYTAYVRRHFYEQSIETLSGGSKNSSSTKQDAVAKARYFDVWMNRLTTWIIETLSWLETIFKGMPVLF